MSKKKLIMTLFAVCMMLNLTSCEQETVLEETQLPAEIKTYISTHFPDNTILQAVKDRDGVELTYDIILSDAITLEFNRKKEIIDISSTSKLPDSVIPDKILAYAGSKYPGNYIKDWEISDKNQQVELDNGLELVFTMSGDFLRIDD